MSHQVNSCFLDYKFCLIAILCVGTTPENVLKQYYYDAYGRIRLFSDCLLTTFPLLYQQGPQDSDWNNFMRWPNFYNVRHEWHPYQIWGFEVIKK